MRAGRPGCGCGRTGDGASAGAAERRVAVCGGREDWSVPTKLQAASEAAASAASARAAGMRSARRRAPCCRHRSERYAGTWHAGEAADGMATRAADARGGGGTSVLNWLELVA
mmetsp:Transcript_55617/g.162603  ORF Transcript_55617/g.162603 Transcript_55617/m.162603 type:complete len:113 (-) Transcript_55617:4-342(-)